MGRVTLGVFTVALLGVLIVFPATPSHAACPVGTYEWVDNWGNRICKSFGTGETRSIEGNLSRCPVGTYPWVDSWGNSVCQSFGGGQRFYDTSKGCPVGTYEWVDNWGNKICKRF